MESKYIVVEADYPDDLANYVNEKIKEGYKPIGGVATYINPTDLKFETGKRNKFVQALFKDNSF